MGLRPSEQRYREGRRNGDKVQRNIAVVEYIIEEKQREHPGFGWENLPWLIQYYPLIRKYLWHLRKVPALNPGMDGIGGLIGTSKIAIFSHLASSAYARTVYIPQGRKIAAVEKLVTEHHPGFPGAPLICKPNRGERSINVRKVRAMEEIADYHRAIGGDYLIQEYIPGPFEFGVSCFRNLDTGRLEVVAIVNRKVAKASGDGKSTIRELIAHADLSSQAREKITGSYTGIQLEQVPAAGELVMLSPVASLAFGTVIEEIRREDHPEGFASLEESINAITVNDEGKSFDGFNYGRFDYRASSLEDLFAGRGKVLELNGAAAMALHACVPGMDIEQRYAIFQSFFDRMLAVCETNRKRGNGRYMLLVELYRKSRSRLHRTSVQWDDVSSALRSIKAARRALKK